MNPTWTIEANGADVTAALRERLESIRLVDSDGEQSDTLTITAEDSLDLQAPSPGAELALSLGYEGAPLQPMGLFILDRVELTGMPRKIALAASGASYARSDQFRRLQDRKTRSWRPGPLSIISRVIANEHGLELVAKTEIRDIFLPHLDQTEESDLSFLKRVAADYDLVVRPTFGRLVIAKRDDFETIKGRRLPEQTIRLSEISAYGFVQTERTRYRTVIASYNDPILAQVVSISVGSGADPFEIREVFSERSVAEAAARARLDGFLRKGDTARIQMPGRVGIFAGSPIRLEGIRPAIDGLWTARRIAHQLTKNEGWKMSIELETSV